ncbi:MAG: hypothetical protein PVF43_06135 [Candidatus Eiseniibacteriota bacterium]
MKDPKKVWVIQVDPERQRSTRDPRRRQRAVDNGRRTPERGGASRTEQRAGPGAPGGRARQAAGDTTGRWHRVHPLLTVIATALLGPLVALLRRRRRADLVWWVAGYGAFAAWITAWCLPWIDRAWARSVEGHLGATGVLVIAIGSGLVVCASWARALGALGGAGRRLRDRWPRLAHDARAVMALGLLLPGLGLLIGRRPGRAASAWWMAGLVVVAGWVLADAAWLWRLNASASGWSLAPGTLEAVYVAALGVGLGAACGWLVLLLDGVRLVRAGSPAMAGGDRSGVAVAASGGRLALALLATLVVTGLLFDPVETAELCDHLALDLETRGLAVVPLGLARLATALDPADPGHVLRVAGLYEALGQPAQARRERARLRARWKRYEIERRQSGAGDPWPVAGSRTVGQRRPGEEAERLDPRVAEP